MGFSKNEAISVENIKVVISNRFLDENGDPEVWELRCLERQEEESIRDSAKVKKPIPGQRGKSKETFNADLYQNRILAASVVYPNLKDAKLQDDWGVKGEDKLLRAMLIPGEHYRLLEKVQEINGYDFQEEVDEIKNS
jgi:hypothetical protein